MPLLALTDAAPSVARRDPTLPSKATAPSYDAFISYNHTKDKPIASALQAAVQRLGKAFYQRRALRLFRDDTSLSATPHLWPSIERALSQARFLVLLASPEAAASPWVDREVTWWLDHRSAETMLIALTSGDLVWSAAHDDFHQSDATPLPPALAGRFADEPRWIDLRPYRDGASPRDARFTELAAEFAAALHGQPKEDLLSQEVRQQRRALHLTWSAVAALLVLLAFAGWQWRSATTAENHATEQQRIAEAQRDLAERNLLSAKHAVARLVFDIAQGFRHTEGVRVATIRSVLDHAEGTIEELLRDAPSDHDLLIIKGGMFEEFAQVYFKSGDIDQALDAAQKGLAIYSQLAKGDRAEASDARRRTTVILNEIGAITAHEGNLTRAVEAYQQAVAILRQLVAADPGDLNLSRDLAVELGMLGSAKAATGDIAGAVDPFEEAIAISRRLVGREPGNPEWQQTLAFSLAESSFEKITNRDYSSALLTLQEGERLARGLISGDPSNTSYQNVLYLILYGVGDCDIGEDHPAQALAVYEEALAIMQRLARRDPENAQWQSALSAINQKVTAAKNRR
jgi:tetratricopeptide (TPR) repeat protein